MLQDLDWHINLTSAKAKISQQKELSWFYTERERERKCYTDAGIHKPSINFI